MASITERIAELNVAIPNGEARVQLLKSRIAEDQQTANTSNGFNQTELVVLMQQLAEAEAGLTALKQELTVLKNTPEYTKQLAADVTTAATIADSNATQKKVITTVLIIVVIGLIAFFIYKKFF